MSDSDALTVDHLREFLKDKDGSLKIVTDSPHGWKKAKYATMAGYSEEDGVSRDGEEEVVFISCWGGVDE